MLKFAFDSPVKAQNGGYFRSRGVGCHPRRVLESHELIHVERGTLAIREEDVEFYVGPGRYLILKPHREHGGIGRFPDDLGFYWLHFQLAPEADNRPISPGRLIFDIPQTGSPYDPDRFSSLFHSLLSMQRPQYRQDRSDDLDIYTLLLLRQLVRPEERPNASSSSFSVAHSARQIIRAESASGLTASTIAARLGYNRDYLGRVFQMTFNMTLTAAIHDQRIRNAEYLFLHEDMSIETIACRSGFSDVAYFRRIFTRLRGITPSTFRAKIARRTPINSDP